MTKLFKITDIKWDIESDDEDCGSISLPTELLATLSYEKKDNLDDIIGDWLTYTYGYCHFGFKYEVVVTNEKGEIL